MRDESILEITLADQKVSPTAMAKSMVASMEVQELYRMFRGGKVSAGCSHSRASLSIFTKGHPLT
jgi:hypothetical protein